MLGAFILGVLIGAITSAAGGITSYALFLKDDKENARGVIGCLFLASGGLLSIGAVVVIFSFVSGDLTNALITGIGVFIGFTVVFALLLYIWMQTHASDESPTELEG